MDPRVLSQCRRSLVGKHGIVLPNAQATRVVSPMTRHVCFLRQCSLRMRSMAGNTRCLVTRLGNRRIQGQRTRTSGIVPSANEPRQTEWLLDVKYCLGRRKGRRVASARKVRYPIPSVEQRVRNTSLTQASTLLQTTFLFPLLSSSSASKCFPSSFISTC